MIIKIEIIEIYFHFQQHLDPAIIVEVGIVDEDASK
jgi:hypothetical protein